MSIHGLCNADQRHLPHAEFNWYCPGQWSDCRNCDDRKCMDCVMRVMHDNCEDSCPMCCAKAGKAGEGA